MRPAFRRGPTQQEVDVERGDTPSFQAFLSNWRRSRSVRALLQGEEARWALVSTSVTVLVAGAVAWLAAATVSPAPVYRTAASDHALLPYQVFRRLSLQGKGGKANLASIAPSPVKLLPHPPISQPPASLDNTLAGERAGGTDDLGIHTSSITLQSGDTLVGALNDAGASAADAHAAVAALQKVFSPRSLRAGQGFEVSFASNPDAPVANITYTPPNQAGGVSKPVTEDAASDTPPKLLSISFSPSIEHEVTVTRDADGSFSAKDTLKKLTAQYHRAGGTIDSSLYLAAMQAGIPAKTIVNMIHIFSYEVDFQRDIHPGDTFQVLYSYYYTKDGKPAKGGDIEYASMKLAGKTYALYRYREKKSGFIDYLRPDGRSAKSLLMRTPVDGARISSRFGMRYHPVLGYTRMHKGVDFAVPVGTPVMAAGNGVVQYAGRARGFGNFLLIRVNREFSTAYGHLSRFARGVHVGAHVHQGQIVAYSGNTGLTTGPHLHYEVREYGHQVNPLKVKIAGGVKLRGHALVAFKSQKKKIDRQLAGLTLETKVADNSDVLRAAKD
jgi:murein DD-endopeptidase MepM/ murein hydrolase activator NlpD